jgi:hypothetical protein
MHPAILIIEPRPEIAAALEEVVASAHYLPIVRPYIEGLDGLGVPVAAIIVRVAFDGVSEPAHRALERIRVRPPVVAIVWDDEELVEAKRLRCDVILRAPDDVGRLCEALSRLVHA